LRAEILGEQKKIYVPVSIKPSIVKKDVLDFKNAVQSKLSGITVKVKADLEAASISGGAKSRADINADVRRKLQEISEIGAQRMAGGGGGVTEAARRAQLKRSLETGGFDIGGLKDIGKQLGVAGVGRFKNVNNLIEKIVTESSIEMVKKYLDPQAVMRNPDRSGLGKVLDTFARGIFNMLGMDPASIRAQQQSSKPKPFTPAGLLPAFTLKGAREEMMRQLTEGISSSAAGGGGRDGKLALTNASNMAVQSVKVREIFDPREFEFATLRLFRVIGDALESASNQAESASNQAKNARIDQSVGALMQSIDNAIKVGRARVRNVSSLLSGKVDVRDLGRSNLLKGVSPVGLLPPAVGRAPSAYRSSPGESQEELFARRTREAYINSAARAADASQSPLALPPARDRVVGQPPLMTAPSIGGSRARPMGMTGSAPPDGPSGGGAEANAFVDASRKALAYNQALTGLRESIRGVQMAQLPLIGGIKGLAGEFGQATKQVLLYGTAYKGLAFLTSLPGEAFNAAKALGTYKNQLQAVTSETGTFSNSLAFVDNLAQRFNVPLESARQGFVKLYASMQPTGFSQEQIEGLFTGISQASAAFGLSADKVDRVNYAFAQMASKGQIMSEELKGQLGDVLPGALSLFAEAAKMSIPEFSKAMEDGAFKAEAMMQVLENVGILMKVKFGAAATGAAKTLQGALNGIQNNLKLMYEAFGPVVNRMAAVFGPKITSLIKNVTDVIKAFEAGVSTTGDSFAAMSPQAQGFYSSIQNSLPPIKALIPSLAAAAQNIGYFASSLATASQPLMGLLKLALDFISIPFVARVGVYATVISVLTSAFTLLKNTGIIQATIAMVRFIATLTVGQVQAWISSIQAAITALVAMARTANIAKLSLMALKVTLISFGVGAVLLGLDFVVQKLFNIGSAADDAKRRTAELTDELARAAETGNVAVTSAKLVEAETKVQSLQESKKILQRLQSGGEVPLSEQDYQRLQRAGLAQGISRSLDPLTGKPTGKGRAAGGSSQINESLTTVQSGLVSALNDAGRAQEALTDSMQVQGNMQRELKASRDQMKDIPAAAGDGTGKPPKEQSLESYYSLQDQLAKNFTQAEINRLQAMHDQRMALQNEFFNQQEARANSFQKESIKFQRELASIENERKTALLKASLEVMQAQGSVAGGAAPMGAATAGKTGLFQGSTGVSSGAHFDVRRQDGAYISPEQARALFDPSVRKQLAMTSAYGPRRAPVPGASTFHRGVDLAGPANTPLNLAAGYAMTGAGEKGGLGYAASVRGPQGEMYDVGHLQRPKAGAVAPRKVPGSEKRDLVAAQQVQIANSQQITTGLNAEELAYEKTKTAIANYVASIFSPEEQTLQNSLLAKRGELIRAGMDDDAIELEMKRYEIQQKVNIGLVDAKKALDEKKIGQKQYNDLVAQLNNLLPTSNKLLGEQNALLKDNAYGKRIEDLKEQIGLLLIINTEERRLAELTKEFKGDKAKARQVFNLEQIKKNIEATRALIDGFVSSTTSDYKGFLKAVISGEDAADALKQFQEGLKDKVLTIFLDFAMAPVEKFLKESLEGLFLPKAKKEDGKLPEATTKDPVEATNINTTATNANTTEIKNLTTAIQGMGAGTNATSSIQGPTAGNAFSDGSALPPIAPGFDAASVFGNPEALTSAFAGIQSSISTSMEGITSSFQMGADSLANTLPSWSDALTTKLPAALTTSTNNTEGEIPKWQESLGKVTQALALRQEPSWALLQASVKSRKEAPATRSWALVQSWPALVGPLVALAKLAREPMVA
jgi:tape measure domain-containing protein